MRQWQVTAYGGEDALHWSAAPEPVLTEHEVLIRVRAVSLNYRDLLNLQAARTGNLPLPMVPCSDGAGEVVAKGSAVTQWQAGDRVAGIFFREWLEGPFDLRYHKSALGGSAPGMLAEMVALPEQALVRIPEHLSFAEAACLPCAAVTAWQALFTRGGLQPGQSVLALGTGGVSVFALQLAHAAGARVLITSSSDDKLARVRALGASEGINYRSTPHWDREVWRMTRQRGVDHVLEVGGPGTLEKSLNSVAAGGQVALIGVLTGFGAPTASLFPLTARNARLDGIYVGSRADFLSLNHFLAQHQLHPVIDRTFPFSEAPAAFAYLRSGQHVGKVTIEME